MSKWIDGYERQIDSKRMQGNGGGELEIEGEDRKLEVMKEEYNSSDECERGIMNENGLKKACESIVQWRFSQCDRNGIHGQL